MPDNRCCRYIERRTLLVLSSFASDHDHKSYARRRAGPRRPRMGMLRSPWQAKPPAPPHSRLLSSAELFRLRKLLALLAQNSLAAELDLVAFERQNLDQNLVAFLQLVAHFAHAVLGDLADVQQAVG